MITAVPIENRMPVESEKNCPALFATVEDNQNIPSHMNVKVADEILKNGQTNDVAIESIPVDAQVLKPTIPNLQKNDIHNISRIESSIPNECSTQNTISLFKTQSNIENLTESQITPTQPILQDQESSTLPSSFIEPTPPIKRDYLMNNSQASTENPIMQTALLPSQKDNSIAHNDLKKASDTNDGNDASSSDEEIGFTRKSVIERMKPKNLKNDNDNENPMNLELNSSSDIDENSDSGDINSGHARLKENQKKQKKSKVDGSFKSRLAKNTILANPLFSSSMKKKKRKSDPVVEFQFKDQDSSLSKFSVKSRVQRISTSDEEDEEDGHHGDNYRDNDNDNEKNNHEISLLDHQFDHEIHTNNPSESNMELDENRNEPDTKSELLIKKSSQHLTSSSDDDELPDVEAALASVPTPVHDTSTMLSQLFGDQSNSSEDENIDSDIEGQDSDGAIYRKHVSQTPVKKPKKVF